MAWKGFFDYAHSNGTSNDTRGKPDHWFECVGTNDADCPHAEYRETRQGKSAFLGSSDPYLVVEPCNYASNIAFYHGALKICDYPNWQKSNLPYVQHLKRGFATLATGSAFWHGSMTYVGKRFDNDLIALIAYYGHQMMTANLNTNSTVIHELSETPRVQNSFDIMTNITEYIAHKPPVEWPNVLL